MKLITLNTWAGRLKEPFSAFLREHAADTDIFCFQEIFNHYTEGATSDYIHEADGNPNLLQEISELLPDFDSHFCPVADNVYGIAIFLKKGIEVINTGEVILSKNPHYDSENGRKDHDRKMQWVYIKHGTKDVMIMNTHGHWDAAGKNDTPNRVEQSAIINEYIESVGSIPKILVGDFNLNPQTESITMLEKYCINLVKEHGILTTRTDFYTGEDRHADYVFISSEVFVNSFKVLPDVVSDHSPLCIDFDVF